MWGSRLWPGSPRWGIGSLGSFRRVASATPVTTGPRDRRQRLTACIRVGAGRKTGANDAKFSQQGNFLLHQPGKQLPAGDERHRRRHWLHSFTKACRTMAQRPAKMAKRSGVFRHCGRGELTPWRFRRAWTTTTRCQDIWRSITTSESNRISPAGHISSDLRTALLSNLVRHNNSLGAGTSEKTD